MQEKLIEILNSFMEAEMEENMRYNEIKERVGWGEEFSFYYNGKKYWISQNKSGRYLTKVEGSETQEFRSTDELFQLGSVEGKSLLEIWDQIEQFF